MSSHFQMHDKRFDGVRVWMERCGWTRAILFAATLSMIAISAFAIPRAQQSAQPAPSQGAAPKPRTASREEATPPSPKGMSYHTTTDRTAVWVGDQFHYLITVDYTSDFEFVLDNLNKENVNMDPFPVIDVQKTVTPYGNNQSRLVVDMTLANFSLTQTDARIPQISLYYFRRDQHTGGAEQAAAESLNIVGPMIGLRSTLPPNPPDLRDAVTVAGWQSSRWVVPALGYGALVLFLAWLGWEAFRFVQSRKTDKGPDRHASMEAVRARWARAAPGDFSDRQAAKDFLDRSYQNVKEYLGYYLNTDALSLTAEELTQEMERSGAGGDVTEKVGRVLSACEAARYSENGTAATAESARGIAKDVREVLNLALKD